MTMQALLLDAVEQRLLRHLDVQFAMMVAGEEPAVMLAAAILSKDAGKGTYACRCRVWRWMRKCLRLCRRVSRCWVTQWTGRRYYSVRLP
jgi:hypothetical protein